MRLSALLADVKIKNILANNMESPERKVISKKMLGDWVIDDVVVTGSSSSGLKVIPLVECGGKGGCGKCNLCGPNDKKITLTYKIPGSEKYKTGEQIKLKRFILNEALAAGAVFGIPILFAFLVQILWYIFSKETANSGIAVFYTFAAALIGIGAVYVVEVLIKAFFPAQVE